MSARRISDTYISEYERTTDTEFTTFVKPEVYVPENFISNLRVYFKSLVLKSDNVFIVGHNEPDLDSIGSAVGLSYAASMIRNGGLIPRLQIPGGVYIVQNDPDFRLDSSVRRLIDDKFSTEHGDVHIRFINKRKCLELLTGNDSLIVTDVNQKYRISLGDDLESFKKVLVIDHHNVNSNTIPQEEAMHFIDPSRSSASEIVFNLLESLKLRISPDIATALLSGIILDTDNLAPSLRTDNLMIAVANLMKQYKADSAYVSSISRSDFFTDMDIYRVILKNMVPALGVVYDFSIEDEIPEVDKLDPISVRDTLAIVIDEERTSKVKLSKVANALREYAGLTFSIGEIDDDIISIHCRSNGKYDAGQIMERFGGGGSTKMASAQIEKRDESTIRETREKILTMTPNCHKIEKTF